VPVTVVKDGINCPFPGLTTVFPGKIVDMMRAAEQNLEEPSIETEDEQA